MVEEGKPAPDFELASDSGERVRLSELRGRPVVLYFYPKDDTPGCTKQARSFRDAYGEFEERGATILGVSPDSEASHVRFKEKHGLPFTLLADPDHEVAEQYGVWVEKNNYGKKSMGIKRSTFVIDAEGNVAKAMLGVSPDGHADVVLEALPVGE
jgi:peroxiredoxin Q/BCP